MAAWLVEKLHQGAEQALREAMEKVGISEIGEVRLAPPADASMGDLGMPCHPYSRVLRRAPKQIAEEIAANLPEFPGFRSVEALNGYVNLRFDMRYMVREGLREIWEAGERLGRSETHAGEKLLIEFSGPNTNKPQHLGHVRNNVLGLAVSNLLEAVGYDLVRANIINDRGIHICKSMLAYQRFGEGATPASSGRKGDFFVGDYYVLFDKKLREELEAWKAEHPDQEMDADTFFNKHSELGAAAQEMLRAWEAGDEATRALWKQMNQWVYEGFDETYARLGIHFDWVDYESDTYILGKDVVETGLDMAVFERREDGAVVCDLAQMGLEGKKVLLRSDGTSVYITQDLGTAMRRFEAHDPQRMIYVVADEQNYHFQVLFGLLNLLEEKKGDRCHHLSYGMVDLPHGRMKSREGTVVDADNLMDELKAMSLERVLEHAQKEEARAAERGEEHIATDADVLDDRAEKIGQAGLKYFILRFAPQTRIRFNPEDSIAPEGETGVYALYSYARINSIFQKNYAVEALPSEEVLASLETPMEAEVVKALINFPRAVSDAAEQLNPAKLAQYLFHLAQTFSSFYNHEDHNILKSPEPQREARLALCKAFQKVLRQGLALLGIEVVEQM
ncbi:MAG: arginine--tRNA ligase [Myxococcales bacterium]|nr:arginine--tRNA ligase [Myxococcales bacterium]